MTSYPDHYKNISSLREKILCDINLKRHLDRIKSRKIVLNKNFAVRGNSDDKNEIILTNTNTIQTDYSQENKRRLPLLNKRNNITLASNSSKSSLEYLYNHSMINRRSHNLNTDKIKNENAKFKLRLKRVSSPLNRGKFEESYEASKKYSEFSKRVKNFSQTGQNERKIIENLRSVLPPLVIKKYSYMKK